MSRYTAALVALLITPLIGVGEAQAAVVINEVAWMGTDESSSCEWIEMQNDGGESVSLSGWTFTIANSGSTPKVVTLGGVLGAGEYSVLMRSAESCVSTFTGRAGYSFTSFGSGISNSASVLTLSDGNGYDDEIDASGGWGEVGGKNETGELRMTAQKSGSSWITALPTPMAENATIDADTPATTTPEVSPDTGTSTPAVTIGGSAPLEGPLENSPVRVLHLDIGSNRVVHAHVATPFRAVAYTENGRKNTDATISWNFGDGTKEEREEVWHTFNEPGTYLVTVRARDEEADSIRTITVVATEPELSVETSERGIVLRNGSDRIADVSGWQLVSGETVFMLPEDTALLPRAAVTFTPRVTGIATSTDVMLRYPTGEIAHVDTYEPVAETVVAASAKPTPRPRGIQRVQKVDLPAPVPEQVHEEVIDAPAAPSLQAAAGAAPIPRVKGISTNWLLCLFGSPLACTAAFVVP